MEQQQLREVCIDPVTFDLAYNRDLSQEVCPETWYLDCVTGEILVVYDNDYDAEREWGVSPADNRQCRLWTRSLPKRFLELVRKDRCNNHVQREDMPEVEYSAYMAELTALLVSRGMRAIWS